MQTSIILANLTEEDIKRFHVAHIPYSAQADASLPYGPYIAITQDCLGRALEAMGWKDVSIKINFEQWIVRKASGMKTGERYEFKAVTEFEASQDDLCKEIERPEAELKRRNELPVFAPGDVVQLKSGGPAMTVNAKTTANLIEAVWFNGVNFESADFHAGSLQRMTKSLVDGWKPELKPE